MTKIHIVTQVTILNINNLVLIILYELIDRTITSNTIISVNLDVMTGASSSDTV